MSRLRRVVQAQMVSGLSQGLGAIQVLLLVSSSSFGRPSDVFTLLFSIGQAPINVAVLGYIYPRALSLTSYDGWARHIRTCVPASLLCSLAGGAYLLLGGYSPTIVAKLVALIAIANMLATATTIYAVALACHGRAWALAGLAVPANLSACAFLVVSRSITGMDPASFMCVGLIVGNAIAFLVCRKKFGQSGQLSKSGPPCEPHAPEGDRGTDRRWLATSGVIGYGGSVLLSAAATQLSAGEATKLGVITKVGLGVVGVGLNAALSVLVNWATPSDGPLVKLARLASRLGLLTVLMLFAVGIFAPPTTRGSYPMFVAGVAWISLASMALLVNRAVYVTGQYKRLRGPTAVSAPLYLTSYFLIIHSQSAITYLASLAAISGLSAIWLAHALRWRAEVLCSAALAASSLLAVVGPQTATAFSLYTGAGFSLLLVSFKVGVRTPPRIRMPAGSPL